MEETSTIITEKSILPKRREYVSFEGRFRHICQGMVYCGTTSTSAKKTMNQPYAALTDATGKDQRFKAKSNGVVHGG